MFDDESALLKTTAHRPWPVPDRPWIMAQRWTDLLFMHWPVAHSAIAPLIPAPLTLDLHGETAWVTIAPFMLSNLHPNGVPPLPWLSEFPELNVRTYVRFGEKAGVFFFSLDAGSLPAVIGARTMFGLPYHKAQMQIARDGDGFVYSSVRSDGDGAARFAARYSATGPVRLAEPGSLDHWLSERYCLYTASNGEAFRTDIHHYQWPLQPAQVELVENSMASAAGIELPPIPPRVSFAKKLDVIVWGPERVS